MAHTESVAAPHELEPAYPVSRTQSRTSALSTSTYVAVPTTGAYELPLREFCTFVDEHRSLQRAMIISVEGYYELIGLVKHRFVVLELCRHGQQNIWLRLDRRRGKGVSMLQFVAARGITMANDIATLSGTKLRLVAQSTLEESRVLDSPPSLADLNRLLAIITEELEEYNIWAALIYISQQENCWLFSSLIQQHLAGFDVSSSSPITHSVKNIETAETIRRIVSARYHEDATRVPTIPLLECLEGLGRIKTTPPNERAMVIAAKKEFYKLYIIGADGSRRTTPRGSTRALGNFYKALYNLAYAFCDKPSADIVLAVIAHARRIVPRVYIGDAIYRKIAELSRIEGYTVYWAGRYDEAIKALHHSIQLYRQLDPINNLHLLVHLIDSLDTFALSHIDQGTAALALEPVLEAVQLAEEATKRFSSDPQAEKEWEPWRLPSCLVTLTQVYYESNDLENACTHGRQAVQLARSAFRSCRSPSAASTFALALEWFEDSLIRSGLREESDFNELCSSVEWGKILAELDNTWPVYSFVAGKAQASNALSPREYSPAAEG
ncbi:hypothetical protein DL93DRAFT_2094689 [Clavulina sp. PMI_390]|nr:hypothetical protein DL93DRAFT_2094689 [Clavulina sp. PMI_390]